MAPSFQHLASAVSFQRLVTSAYSQVQVGMGKAAWPTGPQPFSVSKARGWGRETVRLLSHSLKY